LKIYRELHKCRDFSFRDQMRRSAVSIMNNIAEGFERKGNKELKRFLYIAKGSCGEVRSMSYLALKLKYLSEESFKEINIMSVEISKMLTGFISKI